MWKCAAATHSRVTKHLVAGATHSAHVPWPNIRFMPLAIFLPLFGEPMRWPRLLYHCRHVFYSLRTGLYVQVSIIMILRAVLTSSIISLHTILVRQQLTPLHLVYILRILYLFSILILLTSRSQNCVATASQFFENTIRTDSKVQLPLPRRKSVSQLSTGNPCFHPPDPRAAVFSFQKQTLRKYSLRGALTSLPTDSLLHPGWKTFLSLYPGVDSSSFRGNQGPISTARYVAASSHNGVATRSCISDS